MQVCCLVGSAVKTIFKQDALWAAALFLPIWVACTVYLAASGGNFLFPVSSLILFGLVLTSAVIFLTRRSEAPAVPVEKPRQESLLLLLYLAVYAFVLFGPVSGFLRQSFTSDRNENIVMLAYKLIVHVAVPVLLLRIIHARVRGVLDLGIGRRGVTLTLIVLSTLMIVVVGLLNSIFEQLTGRGFSVGAIVAWAALAWFWMAIESGICEEFLFRCLLQSRLTAWIGSGPMAIVITSVIFALVHVPALYLRGGDAVAQQASSLPQMMALTVGAIAPISILFGTLWYRTRSFLLIVLVHGATDALPAIDKMLRIWA
jgi:membrane protease YdiL (CAAX protease family)